MIFIIYENYIVSARGPQNDAVWRPPFVGKTHPMPQCINYMMYMYMDKNDIYAGLNGNSTFPEYPLDYSPVKILN